MDLAMGEKFKKAEENFRQEEKTLEEEKNKLHSEMGMYKIKRRDLVGKLDEEIYETHVFFINFYDISIYV